MQIALGNYFPGQSLLHRLDPRLKFLAAIFSMIVIFMLDQPVALFGYAVFLIVLALIARVPASLIWRSAKPVLFLALFAFVINALTIKGNVLWSWGILSVTGEGLRTGLILAARLFMMVITTSLLLTLVTTTLAIADAIEALLKPLIRFGFPAHELAMMLSIALRFVPTLAEETDKIMKAQSSRGADFDTGGLFARLKGFVIVLVPLFISAFKRAEDLAVAMEARCYRGGEGRTKLHSLQMMRTDWLAALAFILIVTVLFVLEYRAWSL